MTSNHTNTKYIYQSIASFCNTTVQVREFAHGRGIPKVYNAIVDRLATITAPTLVLWGLQDRILPVAHAQVAIKGLPRTRLHIFDLCGHWPQFEHSEEFNTLVSEFLAN